MDNIEDIKKKLVSELKRSSYPIRPVGGQSCGVLPRGVTIECEHTSFKLSLNEYRSQLQNLELAVTLYKLYLDEVIK